MIDSICLGSKLGLPAAGFFAPDALLEREARRRGRRLVNALPDALDLLAVGAAAGRSPGTVIGEIATGTGIDRSVVYSAASRLAASGRLRRVAKGERQVGYAPADDESAGRAAGPETEPAEVTDAARDAVGSRAGGLIASGEKPRVPVGAVRSAGKRARAVTGTVCRAGAAGQSEEGGAVTCVEFLS